MRVKQNAITQIYYSNNSTNINNNSNHINNNNNSYNRNNSNINRAQVREHLRVWFQEQHNGSYTQTDAKAIYAQVLKLKNDEWKLKSSLHDDWVATMAERTRQALRHVAQGRIRTPRAPWLLRLEIGGAGGQGQDGAAGPPPEARIATIITIIDISSNIITSIYYDYSFCYYWYY